MRLVAEIVSTAAHAFMIGAFAAGGFFAVRHFVPAQQLEVVICFADDLGNVPECRPLIKPDPDGDVTPEQRSAIN